MKINEIKKGFETKYIIINEINGKIIDDAQGYGFKSKQAAYKCYNYKFNGGKEKDDSIKDFVKNLLKNARKLKYISDIQKLIDDLEYELFRNFKDYNLDLKEQIEHNKKSFEKFEDEIIKLCELDKHIFTIYKTQKIVDYIQKFI